MNKQENKSGQCKLTSNTHQNKTKIGGGTLRERALPGPGDRENGHYRDRETGRMYRDRETGRMYRDRETGRMYRDRETRRMGITGTGRMGINGTGRSGEWENWCYRDRENVHYRET